MNKIATPSGLTHNDISHARCTYIALQDDCAECSRYTRVTGYEGHWCDCQLSETIMTSLGYVEVTREGQIVAFGQVLATVD